MLFDFHVDFVDESIQLILHQISLIRLQPVVFGIPVQALLHDLYVQSILEISCRVFRLILSHIGLLEPEEKTKSKVCFSFAKRKCFTSCSSCSKRFSSASRLRSESLSWTHFSNDSLALANWRCRSSSAYNCNILLNSTKIYWRNLPFVAWDVPLLLSLVFRQLLFDSILRNSHRINFSFWLDNKKKKMKIQKEYLLRCMRLHRFGNARTEKEKKIGHW